MKDIVSFLVFSREFIFRKMRSNPERSSLSSWFNRIDVYVITAWTRFDFPRNYLQFIQNYIFILFYFLPLFVQIPWPQQVLHLLHYLLGFLFHVQRFVPAFVDFILQKVEVLNFVDLKHVLGVLLPLNGSETDVAIVELGVGVMFGPLEGPFQFWEFNPSLGGWQVEWVVAGRRIEISDFE